MIEYTGITFTKGSPLTAEALNILNNKINELARVVNLLLRDRVNINLEVIGEDTEMSLTTAITQVPRDRRESGVSIKFNEIGRGWSVYTWDGSVWENTKAWIRIAPDLGIIDGGEA